jgi:hypothetical protein
MNGWASNNSQNRHFILPEIIVQDGDRCPGEAPDHRCFWLFEDGQQAIPPDKSEKKASLLSSFSSNKYAACGRPALTIFGRSLHRLSCFL